MHKRSDKSLVSRIKRVGGRAVVYFTRFRKRGSENETLDSHTFI